jgi:hypothetical protein
LQILKNILKNKICHPPVFSSLLFLDGDEKLFILKNFKDKTHINNIGIGV